MRNFHNPALNDKELLRNILILINVTSLFYLQFLELIEDFMSDIVLQLLEVWDLVNIMHFSRKSLT